MTTVQKSFFIQWDDFHRDARALGWRLQERGAWKGIVAVTRGGLVPAAIVARELRVRLIDTASVMMYTEDDANPALLTEPRLLKAPEGAGDGEGWLVVDDLVDTGLTFQLLRTVLPRAHFAAVYAKPKGKMVVDTFVTGVSQDTWIYFPWEVDPATGRPAGAEPAP